MIEFPNRHIYYGALSIYHSCSGINLRVKGEALTDYLRPEKLTVFTDAPWVRRHRGWLQVDTLEVAAVGRVLLDLPEAGVPPGSVGVIAPHRVQYRAIRAQFPRRGFEVSARGQM